MSPKPIPLHEQLLDMAYRHEERTGVPLGSISLCPTQFVQLCHTAPREYWHELGQKPPTLAGIPLVISRPTPSHPDMEVIR